MAKRGAQRRGGRGKPAPGGQPDRCGERAGAGDLNCAGRLMASEARALADEIRSAKTIHLSLRLPQGEVRLSNLGKVFWPRLPDRRPLLKRDFLAYYAEVSPWLLPYLRDRPLTLRRYVDGIAGHSFYQRDWHETVPEYVRLVSIYAPSARRDVRCVVCDNVAALLWLANTANLEMHAWYARVSADGNPWPEAAAGSEETVEACALNYPDYIVFDLDPWTKAALDEDANAQRLEALDTCKHVAKILREKLAQWGLMAFVKTSGKTGLHLFVPIIRAYRFETTRELARHLARELSAAYPDLVTAEWRIEKRKGKVL
ncbi:MAG: hypothetical protein N2512_03395, partial [Armatimonadetes bacterium]|nr:hypothetical protein [Armatimonadota bacterium]